jgi:hypothetical protein
MQDFLSGDPSKALKKVKEDLYIRLDKLRNRTWITDPNPDWFNTHDYSSGHFRGCQQAIEEEIRFLEDLLDKIERS